MENQIERKEKQKKYYEENKKTIIREYRETNKDYIKEYSKKYHSDPLVRERINNQRKDKYKNNLNYRLSCVLRSRFLTAMEISWG